MQKLAWLAACALPFAAGVVGMSSAPKSPSQPISYAKQVAPLLKAQCVGCHSPDNALGGLDLSSPAGIAKGGVSGPLFKGRDASASLLLQRINGEGGKPRMPMGFAPLSAEQVGMLKAWVEQGAPTSGPSRTFAKDVAPTLKAYCMPCHAGNSPSAGLDLSTENGFKLGGDSGPLFKAGDPKNSLILKRIRGEGGLPRMPMGFAPLNADRIAAIEAWIQEGASFESGEAKHWAYRPVDRPSLPSIPGVAHPVDRFIRARLAAEGMKPSPRAAKETLLRRVHLDLTGIPPTPQELDTFLADARPDAYERVVDRLLASPHYGERQAIKWLDLARYADSHGYEKDGTRTAWKYRDWVVQAFNRNLPYDRFTVEQLAGDMLPKATLEQLVATGFHRNTMLNLEGGVDPDEAMYQTILDRVGTTSTVWLGQTMACAQCHDHKYDPISQDDFFRFYAFFNNNEFEERGSRSISEAKYFEPDLPIPSPAQAATLKDLDARIAEQKERVNSRGDWIASWRDRGFAAANWTPVSGLKVESNPARKIDVVGSMATLNDSTPDQATYTATFAPGSIRQLNALAIDMLPMASAPNKGPGLSENGNFILSSVQLTVGRDRVPLALAAASHVQGGYSAAALLDENAESGWAVAPRYGVPHRLIVQLREPMPVGAGDVVQLALEFGSKQWPKHVAGSFQISLTEDRFPMSELLKEKSDAELGVLDPTLGDAWQKLAALQDSRRQLMAQIPTAMVMRERQSKGPLKAWTRIRGEFLQKGKEVEADSPSFLPSMPSGERRDRLSLARWLVRADNPLTARVQMNRMWEQLFGRGLVETSENFGTQGTPPSHPELLDWLASEFVARKWNMKAMMRLLVTSETYKQSSVATPSLLAKDPSNVLLARGPRFRLDAELIRDVALSAGGLLDPTLGGPPVFPDQPAGIWNSPYSGERWMTSEGKNRFRRGIYTFWKRTASYPSFMALDATSRETCTVRRTRTNTPLQSLAMLNDVAFFEAAKGLGARILREAPKDDVRRIRHGFRLATARTPNQDEVRRLLQLLKTMRTRYAGEPEAAKNVAGTPEQAAWTMVGNVLLNLDETVTKG